MPDWRFAELEEEKRFRKLPSVTAATGEPLSDPAVYLLAHGVVRSAQGELVKIPSGMLVTMLDNVVDEPWCYRVEAVSVWARSGLMDLRRGTPVAAFHPSKVPTPLPNSSPPLRGPATE